MSQKKIIQELLRENKALRERIVHYEEIEKSAKDLRKAAANFDKADFGVDTSEMLQEIIKCVVDEALKNKAPNETMASAIRRVDNETIVNNLQDEFIEKVDKHYENLENPKNIN